MGISMFMGGMRQPPSISIPMACPEWSIWAWRGSAAQRHNEATSPRGPRTSDELTGVNFRLAFGLLRTSSCT